MRRLALLSTVLLALFAACGSEAEPVAVTGVIQGDAETVSGEFSGEPIEGSGESWTSARDVVYRGVFADMSDDRVNGEIEHVMDMDLTEEGDRFIASLTITSMSITNDGGTWEGTGEGTSAWTENGLHVHNINYTLIGTGDYEGLQFTYNVEDQGDYPWDITGTIEPVES
jgi:hypothetical protein